jgi:hypothetical protein
MEKINDFIIHFFIILSGLVIILILGLIIYPIVINVINYNKDCNTCICEKEYEE